MINIRRYTTGGTKLWVVDDNTIDDSTEILVSSVFDLKEMKQLVDNLVDALWEMCSSDDGDELTEYVREKIKELLSDIGE